MGYRVLGALDWEFSCTFWENTGPFSIETGAENLAPKTALKNP